MFCCIHIDRSVCDSERSGASLLRAGGGDGGAHVALFSLGRTLIDRSIVDTERLVFERVQLAGWVCAWIGKVGATGWSVYIAVNI